MLRCRPRQVSVGLPVAAVRHEFEEPERGNPAPLEDRAICADEMGALNVKKRRGRRCGHAAQIDREDERYCSRQEPATIPC